MRETDEQRRARIAETVAAERAAQGLPRHVEDPAVLERIATLLERRPAAR